MQHALIIIATVAIGILLFQILIAVEGLRRLIANTREAMQIDWGRVHIKPIPRRYMIRHAGTMTIDPSMPAGVVTLTSHTDADFDTGDNDPYHSHP